MRFAILDWPLPRRLAEVVEPAQIGNRKSQIGRVGWFVHSGGRGRERRRMRILVTGITGRIGANLAAALVERGHQVRGLVWARDARVEKLEGLGVELQYGSLTEAGDVQRAVEGMEVV